MAENDETRKAKPEIRETRVQTNERLLTPHRPSVHRRANPSMDKRPVV
jgi:hypothetical protein